MARRKVTISQFVGLVKSLPDDLEKAAVTACRKSAERLKALVVEEISENEPFPVVDRGLMRQSVGVIKLKRGAFVTMGAPYAAVQEGGSRPFTPPLEPLIAWAMRKGHPEPEKFARIVQQSIRKKGVRPKRYFARALKRWREEGSMNKEISAALKRMAAKRRSRSR